MRIPIENTGKSTLYVAGRAIPAGETLLFEEHELPPEYRAAAPAAAEEITADPLVELLVGNVDAVKAGLANLLDDDLLHLQQLEFEGKKRKGVLEAVTAEGLRRAELKVSAEGNGAQNVAGEGQSGEGGEDSATAQTANDKGIEG